MTGKLKTGALLLSLTGLGAVILLQRLELKRQATETADLRRLLSEMPSLRENQEQLGEQVHAAVAAREADQAELLRLRGQSTRMRQIQQENIDLKAQFKKLDEVVREAQREVTVPPQPAGTAPGSIVSGVNTTDLGMVELIDRTAARFSLGGGTNCVLTPIKQPDGTFTLKLWTEAALTGGPSSVLAKAFLRANPNQQCSVLVGDRMITVGVTFK